jgi:DNA replicative helicase MCM subunit Mcm2 (Cdc46/Mcm family)
LLSFIKEHQIVKSIKDDDDSDDDDDNDDVMRRMIIPSNDGSRLVRQNCYIPHLQRIKNRQFYSPAELEDTNIGQNNTNNNSSTSSNTLANSRTFIIELPLDELCSWDDMKGKDLAIRISENCMRYHDLFCDAIDSVLESLSTTTEPNSIRQQEQHETTDNGNTNNDEPNLVRDAIDILHQQRLDVMERNRMNQLINNDNGLGDGTVNVYARNNGGIETDQAAVEETVANRNNAGSMNATEDFPPILMRRYELRILPYQRKGSLPPFVNQRQINNNNSTSSKNQTTQVVAPISLRQIRSKAVGKLMSVTGMIVRCSDVKPSCQVATYSCDSCGAEIYQVLPIYNKEFMPARSCPSGPCQQQPMQRRMARITQSCSYGTYTP